MEQIELHVRAALPNDIAPTEPSLRVIHSAVLCCAAERGSASYGITVLTKNRTGIKELYTVASSANNGDRALIDTEVLKKHRRNLLVGTCGNQGELFAMIARGDSSEAIEKKAAFYDYFEIYPTNDEAEQRVYASLFHLGCWLGVPVLAIDTCHRREAGDALLYTNERVLEALACSETAAVYQAVNWETAILPLLE